MSDRLTSHSSSSFLDTQGKEPLLNLTREGRGLEIYSPIIYWIGWLAILYIVLYVISVYITPSLFSSRPTYPYYIGRSLRSRRQIHDKDMLNLIGSVLPAIDKRR